MWSTDKARISIFRDVVNRGGYKDMDKLELLKAIRDTVDELYNGVNNNELGDKYNAQYFVDRLKGSIYKLSVWCDYLEEKIK
jgi:hypothetical protein